MKRWTLIGLALVAAFGLLTRGAMAGGWATVTLDTLPKAVRAGENVQLGFVVRQHGDKPVNSFYGEPLTPYLVATHTASQAQINIDGRQEGEQGHFVLDVTFPNAGAWTFKIIPAPFPDPSEVGLGGEGAVIPLNVLPAASEPAGDAARQFLPAVAAPQTVDGAAPTNSRNGVWIATGGVLVLALGLTVLVQRGGLRRRIVK